jgi:ribosomal protein L29
MKYKELKSMPIAEARRMLTELRTEAHDLSVKIRLKQLKDTHKAKQVKKDIARLLTFLHAASSK